MATMITSKTVTYRTNSTKQVRSAYQESTTPIANYFRATYGEEAALHTLGLLVPVMAWMTSSEEAVLAAIAKLTTERRESIEATAEKERCAEACRARMLPVRDTLKSFFGEKYAADLGFAGPLPDNPEAVVTLSTYVQARVVELPVPPCLIPSGALDPKVLVASLAEPTAALKAALVKSANEKKESDSAQIEKDRAVEQFDRAFKVAASLLSTLLDCAGETERARRVRPSTRRPGTTVAVAADDSETTTTRAASSDSDPLTTSIDG